MTGKHEWKPGDRFEGVVDAISPVAGMLYAKGGPTGQSLVHPDAVTPIPDHREWVGKPIRELTAGTRFDLHTGRFVIRVMWTGEEVRCCTPQDMPGDVFEWDDNCTVIRIHKLGEVRPKTLGDCPALESWKDGNGDIHFNDGHGNHYFMASPEWSFPVRQRRPAVSKEIRTTWTRLGPIEGIKIGGVIYGEGE